MQKRGRKVEKEKNLQEDAALNNLRLSRGAPGL